MLFLLVRPDGFEPPTPWFEARYSIQLSYGRMEPKDYIIIPLLQRCLSGACCLEKTVEPGK